MNNIVRIVARPYIEAHRASLIEWCEKNIGPRITPAHSTRMKCKGKGWIVDLSIIEALGSPHWVIKVDKEYAALTALRWT